MIVQNCNCDGVIMKIEIANETVKLLGIIIRYLVCSPSVLSSILNKSRHNSVSLFFRKNTINISVSDTPLSMYRLDKFSRERRPAAGTKKGGQLAKEVLERHSSVSR